MDRRYFEKPVIYLAIFWFIALFIIAIAISFKYGLAMGVLWYLTAIAGTLMFTVWLPHTDDHLFGGQT